MSLYRIIMLMSIAGQLYAAPVEKKPTILVVMGSARQEGASRKIAHALEQLMEGAAHCTIVDLKNLNLPLVNPHTHTNNHAVHAWRAQVAHADAVILLSPVYNAGYSGILKNALDALDAVAANKAVGLIGYAGGFNVQETIDALMPVIKSLGMRCIGEPVKIPMAERAFTEISDFKKADIEDSVAALLDALYITIKS